MFLLEQPLEFDHKKSMYINMLKELRVLEKCHTSILDIKEQMIKADIVHKYLGTDKGSSGSKTNDIKDILARIILYSILLISFGNWFLDSFIYYKESLNPQPVKSMEVKFKKNNAMIESKQKLLIILNTTHLFQRSYCINI